ncbi:MAG: YlmC/YmxH family sporulation protein [Symbiobacteriia bacterium]
MHKISDLRQRDVINIMDGKRLGLVSDVDVDPETGRIIALIVPGPGRFLGIFGGGADFIIHWHKIVRIGPDVILVDLNHDEPSPGRPPPGGMPPGFPPGFGPGGPAGFGPGGPGGPGFGPGGPGGPGFGPGGPGGPGFGPGGPGGLPPGAFAPGGPLGMGLPGGPMPGGMPPGIEAESEGGRRRRR